VTIVLPKSNFVPLGESASDPTPPTRFPGATICLTSRPVRTSKITTRGLGETAPPTATDLLSGEKANDLIQSCVRRSAVPRCSRARGGKEGLAMSVSGCWGDSSMAAGRLNANPEATT
jgi:hypothetical protein